MECTWNEKQSPGWDLGNTPFKVLVEEEGWVNRKQRDSHKRCLLVWIIRPLLVTVVELIRLEVW